MAVARRPTKEELVKGFRTSEITEAARRVIGNTGYADASMERIAHEAGVAKGTLYLYFKNKEELLAHVFAAGYSELIARSRAATAGLPTHAARLEGAVRTWFEHASGRRAFLQGLHSAGLLESDVGSAVGAQVRALEDAYVAFLAETVAQGTRAGEFRKVPPQPTARFLLEILRGAVLSGLREPEAPHVDEAVETIVDLMLHGIGAREKP